MDVSILLSDCTELLAMLKSRFAFAATRFMNTDQPIPEIEALLDRLDQSAESEVVRQIQAELEHWISRHSSELQRPASDPF
jgi:hypothetical protein